MKIKPNYTAAASKAPVKEKEQEIEISSTPEVIEENNIEEENEYLPKYHIISIQDE